VWDVTCRVNGDRQIMSWSWLILTPIEWNLRRGSCSNHSDGADSFSKDTNRMLKRNKSCALLVLYQQPLHNRACERAYTPKQTPRYFNIFSRFFSLAIISRRSSELFHKWDPRGYTKTFLLHYQYRIDINYSLPAFIKAAEEFPFPSLDIVFKIIILTL
jgi:hypothetical protein